MGIREAGVIPIAPAFYGFRPFSAIYIFPDSLPDIPQKDSENDILFKII